MTTDALMAPPPKNPLDEIPTWVGYSPEDCSAVMWDLGLGLGVCQWLEHHLRPLNVHVALAGSCLYRGHSDKDLDVILYPRGDSPVTPKEEVRAALHGLGFVSHWHEKPAPPVEPSRGELAEHALVKALTKATGDSGKLAHVWVMNYRGRRVDFIFLKPRAV